MGNGVHGDAERLGTMEVRCLTSHYNTICFNRSRGEATTYALVILVANAHDLGEMMFLSILSLMIITNTCCTYAGECIINSQRRCSKVGLEV